MTAEAPSRSGDLGLGAPVSWARNLPLRRLLAVFFMGLVTLALGALGLGLREQVHQHLWRAAEDDLRRTVEVAWGEAPAVPPRGPSDGPRLQDPSGGRLRLQEIVRQVSSSPGTRARLLRPDGEVLVEGSGAAGFPEVPRRVLAELRDSLARDRETGRVPRRRGTLAWLAVVGREPWVVLALPVEDRGHLSAVLQVAGNWHESARFLATLRSSLGLALLGAGFACLVGCLVLSRALAQPVERMIATVEKVAGGDLDVRVALGPGENEIFRLAAHFDRMVERLQAAFAAQRRFVADASHELQSPLTNVGGMADVLRLGMDSQDPEIRRRAVDTIAREVDRMSRTVADLLLLSRVDDAPLERQRIRVEQVADEAALHVESRAPERTFTARVEPGLAFEADPRQVERAVGNLLDNALQYSPAEAPIEMRAFSGPGRVCLEVADRGDGISPEDLPHVMDRFYRADRSRSRKTGGSGLGLSIVRTIVERHGGEVEIASTLGQGTVVRLWWPTAPGA